MRNTLACTIVETALATQKARPELSALQVLDVAMRGRHCTTPDFGAVALDPFGPFGVLLAAAFEVQAAPALALASTWVGGNLGDGEALQGKRVRDAFTARYRLREQC